MKSPDFKELGLNSLSYCHETDERKRHIQMCLRYKNDILRIWSMPGEPVGMTIMRRLADEKIKYQAQYSAVYGSEITDIVTPIAQDSFVKTGSSQNTRVLKRIKRTEHIYNTVRSWQAHYPVRRKQLKKHDRAG